jgi:pyruvate formate lyase activating enzyme
VNRTDETGIVLELQRLSTEDGPGVRTTVFLKGCTLSCAWCHNPESIDPRPQVQWMGNRCIGCRTCVAACPQNALELTGSGMQLDRSLCTGCGVCVTACPSGAMDLLGARWTVEGLLAEVVKDRAYFGPDGGVTVSGGEPTLQGEFCRAFLAAAHAVGLHTAVDTCGMAATDRFLAVAREADLVLYDLKEADSMRHRTFTGQENTITMANVLVLADMMRHEGLPRALWIRTPLIPGATAADLNIRVLGAFIAENLADVVSRWDLCAFNNLARDKYARLGRDWLYAGTPLMSAEEVRHLVDVARSSGVHPDIVRWSGRTRMDDPLVVEDHSADPGPSSPGGCQHGGHNE